MGSAKRKTNTPHKGTLKPLRDSNIELLRILAMIGIVISHLTFSSPHSASILAAHDSETFYLTFLSSLGQVGNLSFFLITGYFLINKDFNFKSVVKLASTTWFYSFAFFVIALIIGIFGLNHFFGLDAAHTTISLQSLAINLMPIIQNNYWFITTYIVILFLSPALNKIILSARKKQLAMVLIGVTVAFFGLNYTSRALNLGLTFEIYNNLLLYSLVYAIGAYHRLFTLRIKTSVLIGALLVGIIGELAWVYRLTFDLHTFDVLNKDTDFAPFLIAMCVFALFLRIKVPHNNLINIVGGSVVTVYLIHTNRNVWPLLGKVFDPYRFHDSLWFYPFMVAAGVSVFVLCIALELSRQYVTKKMLHKTRARLVQRYQQQLLQVYTAS